MDHRENEQNLEIEWDENAAAGPPTYNVTRERLKEIIRFMDDHNASNALIDGIGALITGQKVAYHNWRTISRRANALPTKVFAMCRNGCKLFLDDDPDEDCCYCNAPRHTPSGKIGRKWEYVPIIPRLVRDLQDPRTREILTMHRLHVPDGSLRDVYDGQIWKSLAIGGLDQVFGLTWDGARWADDRPEDFYVLTLIPFNSSVVCRQKEDAVYFVLAVDASNGVPADLKSFLSPFFAELGQLERGLSINIEGQDTLVKGFVISAIGDYPGISMISNTRSHSSRQSCRYCRLLGRTQKHTGNCHVYMVYTLDQVEQAPSLRNHQDIEDLLHMDREPSQDELHGCCLNAVSPFWELQGSLFPWFLAPDSMHAIVANTTRYLVEMLGPQALHDDLDTPYLNKNEYTRLLDIVPTLKKYVDPCFGSIPPSYARRPGYFKCEHLRILIVYFLPSILHSAKVLERYVISSQVWHNNLILSDVGG